MRVATWADFEAAAGRVYALELGDVQLDLTLEQAEPLPQSQRRDGGFRLEFLGPPDPVLPQAIYPLGDGAGESYEMFLVPIGRDATGTRYEAIYF